MGVNLNGFQLIPNCGNMRFRPAIFISFLFAQFFFKFYQNGGIQKLNACCFQLLKNYFHTNNIECARSLQSSIIPVLYTLYTLDFSVFFDFLVFSH